jgi:hypothetical protein
MIKFGKAGKSDYPVSTVFRIGTGKELDPKI